MNKNEVEYCYSFGAAMPGRTFPIQTAADNTSAGTKPYRYGFNGKESDFEVKNIGGSSYDYGMRIYDPRLGRFLSVDPITKDFPWYTPYQFAGNTPIQAVDLDGREPEGFMKTLLWMFGLDNPQEQKNNEEIIEQAERASAAHKKVAEVKKNIQTMQEVGSEVGHAVLDGAGCVPVIGEPADGVNAAWYYQEKDYVNGSLSLASMVPFVGWAAVGAKWGGKILKNSPDFYKAAQKLHIPERIAKFKEVAENVAKENKWTRNTALEKKNTGRTIYSDKDGLNYSLDTQHGTFEVLNNKGKHQGEVDFDGVQTKAADKSGAHDINVK